VKSLSEGELWMLDRALFTKLLRDSRLQKRAKMIDVISRISPSLTQVESSLLADVMEEKLFLAGDKISFGFFIVVSGDVLLNGAHILHSDSFHLDASLRDDGLALSPQVTILFLNGPDVTRLYDELMVVVQARPSSSCSSLKTMSSLKAVSSENTLVNSYLQDSFKPTSSSFKVANNKFVTNVRILQGKEFVTIEEYIAFLNVSPRPWSIPASTRNRTRRVSVVRCFSNKKESIPPK